jgi:flagellin
MQIAHLGSSPGLAGAEQGRKALSNTNRSLQKILERLSTAQRINRASDDAAGLAISEQLQSQIRGFKMAEQNINDAMSALTIADGTANQSASILQRQRELALQARSDTLTNDQRAVLDTEYQQLSQELNRIADSSQFNTQSVANGEGLADGDGQIQNGPASSDQITMPQIDISGDSLGVNGTAIATSSGAANALSALDSALSSLGGQRSTLGATFNRFESMQTNLHVAQINTQAADSVLRDQDMAAGLAELARNQLLQESGSRAFSRFQQVSANHLLGLLQ